MTKPVSPDFHEVAGKYMFQKQLEEFNGMKSSSFNLLSFRVFILKGDHVILQRNNISVTDSDAKDVRSDIS